MKITAGPHWLTSDSPDNHLRDIVHARMREEQATIRWNRQHLANGRVIAAAGARGVA